MEIDDWVYFVVIGANANYFVDTIVLIWNDTVVPSLIAHHIFAMGCNFLVVFYGGARALFVFGAFSEVANPPGMARKMMLLANMRYTRIFYFNEMWLTVAFFGFRMIGCVGYLRHVILC